MATQWPSTDMFVDAAMTAASREAFRATCLAALAPVVGCEAALMQTSRAGAPMLRGATHALDFASMELIGQNLGRYQLEMKPLLQAVAANGAAVDVEVLGWRRQRELSLTREVIAPLGLGAALVVGLPIGPFGLYVNLVFLRARHASPFPSTTVEALGRLVPVLTLGERAHAQHDERAPTDFAVALTPTEWQLVDWVQRGYSNQQIALATDTSPFTVRNRLMRLYRKLGVGARTEMLWALGLTRKVPGDAAS